MGAGAAETHDWLVAMLPGGSEALFRQIAEAIPHMVWCAGADGMVHYCNQQWYEYTGLSARESEGSGWQIVLHPEQRAECVQRWALCVAHGQTYEGEYRLRRGYDGRYRWHVVHAVPLRDEYGNITRWFGTYTDVHQRKRTELKLQRQLAEAESQLQTADNHKSEFLMTISHELRTPLNAITGFTSMLLTGEPGPVNAEQRKQLEMVLQSSQRLLGMVNDIIQVSRIECGKMDVRWERVPVSHVVSQAVESVQKEVDRKGLRLLVRGTDQDVTLLTDRHKLVQILHNLLSNAVKFTRQGNVSVSVRQLAKRVEIAVEDTGPGIKVELLPHIFDIFRQGDQSTTRLFEGLGLGLHLCRRLSDLLGGTLMAESEVGSGARFILSLPRLPQP